MSAGFPSTAHTTLDLADNQFVKIRRSPTGYAVFLKVVQTGKPRWTFTREIKADTFAQTLDDPLWAGDILAARLRNLLIDCWRSKFDI